MLPIRPPGGKASIEINGAVISDQGRRATELFVIVVFTLIGQPPQRGSLLLEQIRNLWGYFIAIGLSDFDNGYLGQGLDTVGPGVRSQGDSP